jgi:chemosensory pili system protein ChpA (sensor histidine kinase/response regulator)
LQSSVTADGFFADFDLGPLSWVQGEIDQALARGLESLARVPRPAADAASLKHARCHVHQAAGAIQMVGLDAVVAFTDEIERQLARSRSCRRAAAAASSTRSIARAASSIFLDELVERRAAGAAQAVSRVRGDAGARGVKAAAPTDLFYPDLRRARAALAPREICRESPAVAPHQAAPPVQRGLLGWLRGDEDGGRTMRDAIAGIEDVTTQASLRAFWWTVGALFEALVEKGLEPASACKQLAARVDLQIRRVAEGSAKVADRLRREVLYYVAISAPVGRRCRRCSSAFQLSGLIPSAEVLSADVVRIQPMLREAREQLDGAQGRVAEGRVRPRRRTLPSSSRRSRPCTPRAPRSRTAR